MAAQQATTSSETPNGERVEFPGRRGSLLVGDLYRAGRDTPWLVLCHGMESSRGGTKQTAIVERFLPRGYSMLRFDFSFVGDSAGVFEDLTVSAEVDDALGALDFIAEFEPRDTTLVGSSLGGLVALLAAAQAPHLVERVATIAAVADTALFTEGLGSKELAAWRHSGRRRFGGGWLRSTFLEDVLAIDAPAAIARLEIPLLVMHGRADRVVPLAHAELIAARARGPVTLDLFDEVGHRFEEPGALARLLDSLERWLAACRSGATRV